MKMIKLLRKLWVFKGVNTLSITANLVLIFAAISLLFWLWVTAVKQTGVLFSKHPHIATKLKTLPILALKIDSLTDVLDIYKRNNYILDSTNTVNLENRNTETESFQKTIRDINAKYRAEINRNSTLDSNISGLINGKLCPESYGLFKKKIRLRPCKN
jgi:hypothetical protein